MEENNIIAQFYHLLSTYFHTLTNRMLEYYYTILLVLVPIILIFLKTRQSKHPPGPKPWPIVGNLHQLGDKPHRSITKLSESYGPIMRIKLGGVTTVVISSPELAKEMFVNHDLALSSRNVPDGLRAANHDKYSMGWLPVGPKWRKLRKISTTHLFANKQLDATQDLRQRNVLELIKFARECCEGSRAMDIGKAVFTTSINVLSNAIFSLDLASYHDVRRNGDASSGSQEIKCLLLALWEEAGRPNVSDVFPFLRCLDLQGVATTVGNSFNKILGLFQEIIDQRLRDHPQVTREDVLANLLNLVQENELSLEDVKHLLFDMFIAGTDTTSTTLEWAMTELLRHPDKMEKAQREVDEHLDKNVQVQESDISKLRYIQAIIKEALRMYPPAPFLLPRKAESDVQFCGYMIPKNAQVWVNVWAIGRDPSVWKNPDSFEPERFLERDIDDAKGRDFEFMPFGEGRRICPGMPLAYRVAHLVLANLLHSFNWKPSDGVKPEDIDVEDKFGIVLQRAQPLKVVPLSR